jgi:hypothetical protein
VISIEKIFEEPRLEKELKYNINIIYNELDFLSDYLELPDE